MRAMLGEGLTRQLDPLVHVLAGAPDDAHKSKV